MQKYLEERRAAGKIIPDGELAGKVGPETTTLIATNGPTHQRIRELHRDHQPLFVAPPPPHFFPSVPHQPSSLTTTTTTTIDTTTNATSTIAGTAPLKTPPLVCSTSAAELTIPPCLIKDPTPSNLKLCGGDPQLVAEAGQPLIQDVAPVAAPSATAPPSDVVLSSPSAIVVQPAPSSTAAAAGSRVVVKGKRGRKPKDPVAHAAKKELQEKRRLTKETLVPRADEMERQPKMGQRQQIVFITEEIQRLNIPPPPPSPTVAAAASIPSFARPTSSSSAKDVTSSRPSTSGITSQLDPVSTTLPLSSSTTVLESKKRTADSAFPNDITSAWLANDDQSLDVGSVWTVSTPIESPIVQSPEEQTCCLDIFLQAPPSTPIEEILSSSAQLGINPALLLQEDIISSMNLSKAVRVLKSPLEILDEYPFHQPASPGHASNRPDTTMDESGHNKKLGLMDIMLLKSNDVEDRPSPKKKTRPDLVFSTTKRGKAIVSLQKNAASSVSSADVVETPTTPVKEAETSGDLRSLVLKRRQEVWGDEVGTEVTRITVHRRITSRKTSTGLMSPLSPTSTAKRMAAKRHSDSTILESDSDSSDSSDSEDEEEHIPQHSQVSVSQVTPLATPTDPFVLTSAQSMQKSFSAPGLFYPHPATVTTENIFLPHTPQEDDDDLTAILNSTIPPSAIELGRLSSRTFDDTGMRCKTCGMLFRKNSVLSAHERTCMVKQTPFIPYDFLKDHVDDCAGFGFGAGRHSLFTNDDIVLTPRNLAAAFDSPLLLQQGIPAVREGKKGMGVVAPKDTVSVDDENEEGEIVLSRLPTRTGNEVILPAKKAVGQPRGQTRCICNKPEKAVAGVMVQWYPLSSVPPSFNQSDAYWCSGNCEYWLHTKCLKVKAKDLPDVWFCPACVGS